MAMHTGVISFCDRIAPNIKSSDTKEEILRELRGRFQVNILQKHWHKLDEEGVTHLYRSPHFACLRSNGNPYYMYFTRYEDTPIVYYIDKKIQPGYQVPRIILGRGKWSESLFNGTLMEGEMVKDKYGGWVFLVNDIMAYKGEYLAQYTLPERLEYGYKIFAEDYKRDLVMDVCKYHIKRYAHATQDGVSALLDIRAELPYTSRGLYLWPFSLKFKPKLYNFDDTLIKTVTRKVKDTPDFREFVGGATTEDKEDASSVSSGSGSGSDAVIIASPRSPTIPPPPPAPPAPLLPTASVKENERMFWLRKTENPDVYDIFTTQQCTQKEGIAYCASLRTSKMLRDVFKDATVAVSIPFACQYVESFSKWLPLRVLAGSAAATNE